jgi:hypothetical protein
MSSMSATTRPRLTFARLLTLPTLLRVWSPNRWTPMRGRGSLHDLLDGLAFPSRELVLHGRRTEDTLDLRPVLTPECLVRALLFR